MNELREKTHERRATNKEYDKRANKGIVSHTNSLEKDFFRNRVETTRRRSDSHELREEKRECLELREEKRE
jgi:hypothetical protein